jgi:hypothetical protein
MATSDKLTKPANKTPPLDPAAKHHEFAKHSGMCCCVWLRTLDQNCNPTRLMAYPFKMQSNGEPNMDGVVLQYLIRMGLRRPSRCSREAHCVKPVAQATRKGSSTSCILFSPRYHAFGHIPSVEIRYHRRCQSLLFLDFWGLLIGNV